MNQPIIQPKEVPPDDHQEKNDALPKDQGSLRSKSQSKWLEDLNLTPLRIFSGCQNPKEYSSMKPGCKITISFTGGFFVCLTHDYATVDGRNLALWHHLLCII